ncbi:glycosyltransferase family 4 protein [Sphingobacterium sp. MYb382]|uniref:glycosyltransferase family 4 protein n=1 Tax=Sphingobacterium sp. MYb382 TaxID=2745278 RepID=UPI003097562D
MQKGINILGYINKQFGLGEGARSNIRAMEAAEIPYVMNDFKGEIASDIIEENENGLPILTDNPYAINLMQINAGNFRELLKVTDEKYFSKKYNIGFWAWELEKFPQAYNDYMEILDELWVPSNFCLNAISQVSSKPVLRFMHSIAVPEETKLTRKDFNLPEGPVMYLTIFDYNSTVSRKNPFATIDAFELAFGKNSTEAILVLKTSAGINYRTDRKLLKERVQANNSIILIEDALPREQLDGLMHLCDVYVSLHRSEGFGLTMAEAMYLGKPVIATGYSSNLEYMNSENSFLVPYTLIPIKDPFFFPELNNLWADADVPKAAEIMKMLADDVTLRESVGKKARNDVRISLAPARIGEKIKERIDYIYENIIPNKGNAEQDIIFNLTGENAILKEKVSALKKIKTIKLKLAFKNFMNKVRGKNKKYIWED